MQYKKSKPFDIDWSAEPQADNSVRVSSTVRQVETENRRHYWRGFMAGATVVILTVATVCMFAPAPDYAVTPAQYRACLSACNR